MWLYYEGNDIINLEGELKNSILKKYLKDKNFSQQLKSKQKIVDKLTNEFFENEFKEKEDIKYKIIKFLKIFEVRWLIKYKPFFQPQPQLQPEFKEILKLAADLSKKNNSNFYLVYLPQYSRYESKYNQKNYNFIQSILVPTDSRYRSYYSKKNYNLIQSILNDLNIPLIDIHKEVFKKENNPIKLFSFELPGHYNVEGFNKTAKAIYKYTKK